MAKPRSLDEKRAHIDVCLTEDVACIRSAGFENIRLEHTPLPEIDLAAVDTTTEVFGRRLSAPLLISPMSGGIERGAELTQALARVAQNQKIALGVGSQRIALEDPELAHGFKVRDVAPDILLFANLGAVNLNKGLSADDAMRVVEMIEADALMLHLNPMQEAIQGGDTCFANLLSQIESVSTRLAQHGTPVVAREVGFGIGAKAIEQLEDAGVMGIDVGGSGGTSWAMVEGKVTEDPQRQRAADVFRDWGQTTVESLEQAASSETGLCVFASGGLRSGLDLAKSVALGAQLGGMATPFLKAYFEGGETAALELAQQTIFELRLAMFGSGTATLAELPQRLVREARVSYLWP